MARKLRLQYAGAIYHVMSGGERREPIFLDDADRKRFLETLEETCAKTGSQVHAYCLMLNHFHLVVDPFRTQRRETFLRHPPGSKGFLMIGSGGVARASLNHRLHSLMPTGIVTQSSVATRRTCGA